MANAGVLVGGGLVLWTGQAWPDLVVGLAVAAIALKGAISILQDANSEAGRS
jgi:Co/Zn/Cd efflux system component